MGKTKKESKKDVKKVKKDSLFVEIKKEMQKVHFPSKKDMVKYSVATISFVIFFGVYFYLIQLAMAFIKSII
ncbi:MAG: preprotein translocase subunit SecE [Erysipelotrichaceae bacterium]|nr:preprotein translocase subunit SecE [Erysipelotrichaceae bacterium]